MHWYFGHPHHHHHYNRLSTHFVNHYYGHRRSGTTITVGVHEWRDRNRSVISDEWLADKNRLPERLREYGRFEEKRAEYNQRNPRNPLDADKFLEKNSGQYPELQRSKQEARKEISREQVVKEQQRADWAPPKVPAQPAPAPRPDRQQWEADKRNQEDRNRREAAPRPQPAPTRKDQPAPPPKQPTKPKTDKRGNK